MKPRIKIGLAAGAVGMTLNVCIATLAGICGPAVSLLSGAAAGLLAVQQEKPSVKAEGARIGAIAGLLAGALVAIGQVIGAVGALILLQLSGFQFELGSASSPSEDAFDQLVYYLIGIGTGLCFGVIGTLLAAGAGAGAGYVAATDQPAPPPPSME